MSFHRWETHWTYPPWIDASLRKSPKVQLQKAITELLHEFCILRKKAVYKWAAELVKSDDSWHIIFWVTGEFFIETRDPWFVRPLRSYSTWISRNTVYVVLSCCTKGETSLGKSGFGAKTRFVSSLPKKIWDCSLNGVPCKSNESVFFNFLPSWSLVFAEFFQNSRFYDLLKFCVHTALAQVWFISLEEWLEDNGLKIRPWVAQNTSKEKIGRSTIPQ